MNEHILHWKQIIGYGSLGNDTFGPGTLSKSIEVARKAGLVIPDIIEPVITGQDIIKLAKTRIGERYVFGADVDLTDLDWHGPWDCAEFCSWVVYQLIEKVIGCVNNAAANPDPYTGGWVEEISRGGVRKITISAAMNTPGAVLLRYRHQFGNHIVFSQGNGKTIEAKSATYGVCESSCGAVSSWNYGLLIEGISY